MAQMTVGMAWGVPVQITELGAHLQAYVEMQPTIAAIRLCNRLGQGPAAYITKLPVELVYMVEEMLMHDVRRRAECTWEESFECFEDRCRPIDHLQQDYHKDMYYRITDGVDMEDDRHLDVLDQMGEMLGETSEHLDEHFSRKSAWRHRVCQHGRPNHQGAFSQYDKVPNSMSRSSQAPSVVRLSTSERPSVHPVESFDSAFIMYHSIYHHIVAKHPVSFMARSPLLKARIPPHG